MAEILSPAGSPEALEAALRCGCDAVYVGGRSFSARANAANFSDEELKEAVRLCHIRGVKLYLAINTLILDSRLRRKDRRGRTYHAGPVPCTDSQKMLSAAGDTRFDADDGTH